VDAAGAAQGPRVPVDLFPTLRRPGIQNSTNVSVNHRARSMLSTWGVFVAASSPMLKVIAISLTGAFAATRYAGILTQDGLKSLSRIIVYILVPSFLFTKLAGTLTLEKLGWTSAHPFHALITIMCLHQRLTLFLYTGQWWLICFFVLLNNCCGLLMGYVIVTLWPQHVGKYRKLVLAACSLGNVGQIPLALASAACTDGLDKFASREGDCEFDSEAMVGFGISVGSLAVWTLGKHLMRPDVEDEQEVPLKPIAHRLEARGSDRGYAELDEESAMPDHAGPESGLPGAGGAALCVSRPGEVDVKILGGKGLGGTGQEPSTGGDELSAVAAGYIVVAKEGGEAVPRAALKDLTGDRIPMRDESMVGKLRKWGSFAYGLVRSLMLCQRMCCTCSCHL
jgi:hypothetical protein